MHDLVVGSRDNRPVIAANPHPPLRSGSRRRGIRRPPVPPASDRAGGAECAARGEAQHCTICCNSVLAVCRQGAPASAAAGSWPHTTLASPRRGPSTSRASPATARWSGRVPMYRRRCALARRGTIGPRLGDCSQAGTKRLSAVPVPRALIGAELAPPFRQHSAAFETG